MERNTKGFSSISAHRDRMAGGKSVLGRRFDPLNPASRRVNRSLRSAAFDQFAREIERDLNPKGPLEQLVTRQAIRSAWRLKASIEGEPELIDDALPSTSTDKAARSLEVAITTLDLLQARHDERTIGVEVLPLGSFVRGDLDHDSVEPNEWPILPTAFDLDPNSAADEPGPTEGDDEAPPWRDRLIYDFDVSDLSPVVKGTWITVSHVVSLIVDGATWADILRSHPELSEADIRMCVAYAVDEDNSRN